MEVEWNNCIRELIEGVAEAATLFKNHFKKEYKFPVCLLIYTQAQPFSRDATAQRRVCFTGLAKTQVALEPRV